MRLLLVKFTLLISKRLKDENGGKAHKYKNKRSMIRSKQRNYRNK